jgi:hypothetical protein
MGKLAHEEHIHDRLRGKRHLVPIFTSTLCIPERLREMDQNYFLVFNTRTQKYEVHNLAHKGNTFGLTVYYDELDYRTLYVTRASDLRVRGAALFREIDEKNERLEQSNERQRRNDLRAMAGELRSTFAKVAWEM